MVLAVAAHRNGQIQIDFLGKVLGMLRKRSRVKTPHSTKHIHLQVDVNNKLSSRLSLGRSTVYREELSLARPKNIYLKEKLQS